MYTAMRLDDQMAEDQVAALGEELAQGPATRQTIFGKIQILEQSQELSDKQWRIWIPSREISIQCNSHELVSLLTLMSAR